ncbi:MAG: TonB-dependent receptor [Alphaproteobacteria bacterium]|nr:MAG: TonB-dependent receptor [Alphaproteobacteria bacterium]
MPRLVPAILALLPVSAAAQTATVLPDILVTAGRTPASAEAVGRSYTVITAEELDRRQVTHVADALRQVPGLAVSQAGTPGSVTQIRIRGAEGNHMLVLIDGVEVSAIATGEYDFGGLIVDDIERIEVLRGPQSALWGSNATAGVISIITRAAARNQTRRGVAVETGTDGSVMTRAFLHHGAESWDAALSAAFRRSDGHDIAATGPEEKEGERNLTLNARVNWDPLPWLSLGGTLRHVDRVAETDGFDFSGGPLQGLVIDEVSENDQRELFLSGFARAESLGGRLNHELRLEYADVFYESVVNGASSFASDGYRLAGGYQASYVFETGPVSHLVTGGIDLKREVNRASTGSQTRDSLGLVGEWRMAWQDLDLTAGLRHDFNDAFRDATTWSVAASWRLREGTRLHASIGTGITNPTFIEQFGFFPGSFIGNPALAPERNFGWDVGVEQSFLGGRLVVDATYFNNRLTDEIVPGFDPVAGLPTSVNAAGTSPRQGVELSLTAIPWEGMTLSAAYTYTLSQDAAGLAELRRPRHVASLAADQAFLGGRAHVGAEVIYTGSQIDLDYRNFFANGFVADRVRLSPFVVVNLTASYQLTETLRIQGRVENLFDADRVEQFGYVAPGVTAWLGLRAAF